MMFPPFPPSVQLLPLHHHHPSFSNSNTDTRVQLLPASLACAFQGSAFPCQRYNRHAHTYTHTHRESTRVTEKKIHSLSLNIILSRRTAPPTLHPHNHPPPQETTPNQTQSQLYHTFISPSTSALTLKSRRIPATTPTISLSLFLPSSCEASPSTRSKSSKRRMSYSKSSNRETASKIH